MWWIVIGVCLWGGWPMAAAQSANLSTMTHSLQNEIMDLMDEEVQYSKPVINTTYVANVEFDMRAMGPLYNSTHIVIDAIAKKQAYPEGVVSVEDYHVNVRPLRAEWRPLLAHYAGPASVLAAAALVAAALPLAGLFWCCCYWCRAGRRRRPFDRKYDACRKGLLAIVLIALLTLFLFGVVCAFATESQVESGSAGAASSVRAGVHDAQQYLNATQAHARWLLVRNYRELKDNLDRMLSGVGVTMSVRLGEQSRAVSVSTLLTLVQRLDDVQAQLRRVQLLTTALRANADKLNSGLRKVKSQLLRTLSECDQPKCVTLKNKYKIGQLDTEIQYSQMLDQYFPTMPDVSELLENVTALLDSNIKEEVAEGQKVFRNIQRSIQRSIDEHVPNVQSALAETGRRLERVADEVTWRAGNASAALGRHGAAADVLQRAHERYGPYRRYAGVAAAVALLAVTCLMVWGLVCGVCGKRPDVYGASDCCNKGAGAKGLLCGTGVTFVVGGAVALVVVPYFAVGLAGQRFLCDPLTEPRGNRLFADLEKVVDLEYTMYNERQDPEFTLASVLVRCHQNDTIYKTLQLQRLYEVQSVRAEVQEELARRVAQLTPPPRREPLAMLQPAAKDKLRWLAHTGLSDFDFDRILSALETNMTSLALDALVRQLNSTARSLSQPAFRQPAAELARAAADLAELNARVLQPMLADSAALNSTATALRDGMRLNYPSLKVAITYLMHETEEAEQFLNTQGPQHLQNMTKQFANVIAGKVDRYIELVEHAARYEVGRCGPLSNAFNATRDAACKKILMPVNGYWISLAWCAVLLVPLLVLAPRLARLYLHLDPYPGPLVEAEYLYDAYADRDNIPLANAYKVEKRSGREGRARGEGEARGGGRAPEAGSARPEAAVAPPLDAHHARRYNDMAPKHWEEGPPRYHGPTEYERPPPYYYPGPADRQ